MKRLWIGAGALALLAACHCNRSVQPAPAIPSPQQQITSVVPPPTEEIVSGPEPTFPKPSESPVVAAAPVVSSVSAPRSTPPEPKTPAVAVALHPATHPAPDVPVFKNEPLINLDGRALNPLADYTPRSDKGSAVPWQGEQLQFGLYYSFIKAGTAYIKNRGLIEADGKRAYVIQTSAFSASVIDSVFKVRDINLSWLDASNFHSLGYSQSLREGKYKRDEWVTFDYPHRQYRGQVQKKAEPRSFTGELTQPVLDILTALYYVRTQPLTPGKEVIFDIINREEQYPLVVKVTGRETVKTAAGKFTCLVVEPQFRGEGIFVSKGKNLKVWLTDDVYKMPVKMSTEVFIGSVYAELLDYKRN